MATQVGICNMALARIGARSISSLDGSSREAEFCKTFYDDVRKSLLRKTAWPFAVATASLALVDTDEDRQYYYKFSIPNNCLRALYIEQDRDASFVLRDDKLYTGYGETVTLVYIKDESDPTLFDYSFVKAFVRALAAELAYPITQQSRLAESMYQIAEKEMDAAAGESAGEVNKDQHTTPDTWLSAR